VPLAVQVSGPGSCRRLTSGATVRRRRAQPHGAGCPHRGTSLWLPDGTVITVHGQPGQVERAIWALRTANSAAGSIAPIGPGESLSGLAAFERK
jgi:hypothetical protein